MYSKKIGNKSIDLFVRSFIHSAGVVLWFFSVGFWCRSIYDFAIHLEDRK